jgi:hypothetical protein
MGKMNRHVLENQRKSRIGHQLLGKLHPFSKIIRQSCTERDGMGAFVSMAEEELGHPIRSDPDREFLIEKAIEYMKTYSTDDGEYTGPNNSKDTEYLRENSKNAIGRKREQMEKELQNQIMWKLKSDNL